MANEKQLIRALTEPTIILDDIKGNTDEKTADEDIDNEKSPYKTVKQMGAVAPAIQVNSKIFTGEEVTSMKIRTGGPLPECIASFMITDKSFYSRSFPKDGDVMSVFIRNKDDLFKPIRNDYIITKVIVSSQEGANEDAYDDITIVGVLHVPGYSAIKCFSKKGTSMKALMQVATDLKLGFASNEVDTADEQVWICPFDKTSDFISDVSNSAWKDDESFFHSFIDPFYYLNFVNVEPIFGEKTEIEESLMVDLLTNDYGNDNVQAKETGKTVLTNWDEHAGTPFWIKKNELFNNSADINLSNGYKRYIQYYDALIKENQILFVDPKTTNGAEQDQVLLKGRPREDFYLEQIQGKWMGVQYGENGENCHEKYNIAKVQNYQNLVHLDKMGLKITLQSINANLRLLQSVPVMLVIKRDTTRKAANQPADESGEVVSTDTSNPITEKPAVETFESPITLDKTVSGFYVIWGIDYIFEKGEFRQDLKLVRREWPTPPTAGVYPPQSN
jgi:hypothetical protein